MKKFYLLLIVVFVFTTVSFSQNHPEKAPVNPDFIEYVEKWEQGLIEKTTPEGYSLGVIPSPTLFNFDYVGIKIDKILEEVYDMRIVNDGNWLTSVKNQGGWGSCWAFATYGAIESYWLKIGKDPYDLSEQNLATCHGFDWGPASGGNHSISTAYLSRWDGPVSEEDDPYNTSNYDCNLGFTPVAYVNQARNLPGIGNAAFDPAIVKQAILDYGGLYVTMTWASDYYNSGDYTFYYNGGQNPNHAVLLVGWDDNKVVTGGSAATPDDPGAWIIRNSWGTGWGEDGFFYISYEDTKNLTNTVYFPSFNEYSSDEQVYYYDRLGAVSGYGWGDDGNGNAHGIARFTASENHLIEKIGTYARAANTNIDIEIYENFNGSDLTGILGSVEGISCDWPGYYTFDLDEPILISEGSDYYIKILYNTGTGYPIPIERVIDGYSSTAEIQPEGVYWASNNADNWVEFGTNHEQPYNISIRSYTAYKIYIESITPVNDLNVIYGTSEGDAIDQLPETTTIIDSEGEVHTVEQDWTIEEYNGNEAGDYAATGTFELPEGVTQSNPETELKVEAIVTVLADGTDLPYIDNITPVDNLVVEYGTSEENAIAQLSANTTITDSSEKEYTVSLSWSVESYDGYVSGNYTATGTFVLPNGVVQSDPETDLEVTATVAVSDPYIVSIADVDDVNVLHSSSQNDAIAELADKTIITDSADEEHDVTLNWTIEDYDGNQPGDYVATGTFELPDGVIQSDPEMDLEVIATVSVLDPHIVSVAGVEDINVPFGTSQNDAIAELADITTITDSADEEHDVALSWSIADYDGNIDGDYTATGTFSLPDGVIQSDPYTDLEVTAKVTVLADDTFVDVYESLELAIFPNPTSNNFTVESNEMIRQIRLIDISGQVIKEIAVDGLRTEVSVHDLRSGMYFMQIHTSNNVITQRVQVTR